MSLKKFDSIQQEPGSYWILVCFATTPETDLPNIDNLPDDFHSVMMADDVSSLDDVTSDVADQLLYAHNHQQTRLIKHTTTNTLPSTSPSGLKAISLKDKRVLLLGKDDLE